MKNESRDHVSDVLRQWRIDPLADPNFRPGVWRRISLAGAETWTGYLRAHLIGWSTVAMLALTVAGWTGHAAAQARLEAERNRMVLAYLVDLDPRVQAKLRP